MKRLEIIHLRLAEGPPALVEEIRRSIVTESAPQVVRIYHQATVAKDLGIHIHQPASPVNGPASDLGLRLAAALEEHGMVEHTVWIEDEPGG